MKVFILEHDVSKAYQYKNDIKTLLESQGYDDPNIEVFLELEEFENAWQGAKKDAAKRPSLILFDPVIRQFELFSFLDSDLLGVDESITLVSVSAMSHQELKEIWGKRRAPLNIIQKSTWDKEYKKRILEVLQDKHDETQVDWEPPHKRSKKKLFKLKSIHGQLEDLFYDDRNLETFMHLLLEFDQIARSINALLLCELTHKGIEFVETKSSPSKMKIRKIMKDFLEQAKPLIEKHIRKCHD